MLLIPVNSGLCFFLQRCALLPWRRIDVMRSASCCCGTCWYEVEVTQSVSGSHPWPATNFSLTLTFSLDCCGFVILWLLRVCYFVAPSLTRGRACNLLCSYVFVSQFGRCALSEHFMWHQCVPYPYVFFHEQWLQSWYCISHTVNKPWASITKRKHVQWVCSWNETVNWI
jgi:hypothetical protein